MAEDCVIETRNLTKKFRDVLAVDRLNMRVKRGEIYGFLGPNGAGKTTTMKMLLGLVHPTAGEVYIERVRMTSDQVEVKKRIGYLPENVSFYSNLTPVQTLNFFCDLKGVSRDIVPHLLREVGLEKVAERKVGTFSKGMVQLLGLAQAMIGEPTIYILDEPSSGLDPRWVKVVRERIRELNRRGATILFSSHILFEVQALCHRVGVINRGRLVAEDSIENLNRRLKIRPKLWVKVRGEVPSWISNIEGVEGVEVEGDEVIITSEAERRLEIIEEMRGRGVKIADFKTLEPSLEEAFMRLLEGEE